MEPMFEVNDEVSQNEVSGIWTKGKVWEAQNMFCLEKTGWNMWNQMKMQNSEVHRRMDNG